VWQPGADPTRCRETVHTPCRRISIQRRRHTLAGGTAQPHTNFGPTTQTCATPSGVLLGDIHTHRMKLRHLRTRAVSRHESTRPLETLLRMDKATIRNPHRPRQPPVLEVAKEPKSTNRLMACQPPRIRLHPGIHPRKNEQCGRCAVKTSKCGPW
jgi:hypothetical protein